MSELEMTSLFPNSLSYWETGAQTEKWCSSGHTADKEKSRGAPRPAGV